jgi:S1/P1 Nuclease
MKRDSIHPLIQILRKLFVPLCIACTVLLLHSSAALAWGCRGHETIALTALSDMTAAHAQATNALLSKFPSTTKIACKEVPGMATAAHESTWADDYRVKHPETGDWHFIDLPFVGMDDIQTLCEKGCTPHAIADQITQFQGSPDTAAAADALRFLIHFVGDAHQPFHDITNNDRGGNCIPTCRFLYLNLTPFRPFQCSTSVSGIVSAALHRAGIMRTPSRGATLLRHTAATKVRRGGATLDAIGSVLRHGSPDTTAHYGRRSLPCFPACSFAASAA